MTDQAADPDQIPNGAGEGQITPNAPDTTSGGPPDAPSDRPPGTEDPNGAPTENPSGG
jgi:hypothetical protein